MSYQLQLWLVTLLMCAPLLHEGLGLICTLKLLQLCSAQQYYWLTLTCYSDPGVGGGAGGRLPYKKGRDAHRKFKMNPLKETNLGVAQAFLTPKVNIHFYISSHATLKKTFTATYKCMMAFCTEHPTKVRPKSKIYTHTCK